MGITVAEGTKPRAAMGSAAALEEGSPAGSKCLFNDPDRTLESLDETKTETW